MRAQAAHVLIGRARIAASGYSPMLRLQNLSLMTSSAVPRRSERKPRNSTKIVQTWRAGFLLCAVPPLRCNGDASCGWLSPPLRRDSGEPGSLVVVEKLYFFSRSPCAWKAPFASCAPQQKSSSTLETLDATSSNVLACSRRSDFDPGVHSAQMSTKSLERRNHRP